MRVALTSLDVKSTLRDMKGFVQGHQRGSPPAVVRAQTQFSGQSSTTPGCLGHMIGAFSEGLSLSLRWSLDFRNSLVQEALLLPAVTTRTRDDRQQRACLTTPAPSLPTEWDLGQALGNTSFQYISERLR